MLTDINTYILSVPDLNKIYVHRRSQRKELIKLLIVYFSMF